jgi:eukaryotic-like serine/threonine-protein kinase
VLILLGLMPPSVVSPRERHPQASALSLLSFLPQIVPPQKSGTVSIRVLSSRAAHFSFPIASVASRLMSVREIVAVGCQVISALHNIHSKGLIHFDVKPDNVLLSDRGEALLSDFGLAKPTTGGLANPGLFYTKMIPPEAPAGATAFNRTWDIYQLGLTLYRMCNGNDEFNKQFAQFGGNAPAFYDAVKAGNFPNRQVFPAHIPQKLRSIIRRCIDVDPVKRYQSALDVANQLAEIEDLLDWRLSVRGGWY